MTTPTSKPVALIIGASRGIGRTIALTLAREKYFVVVSAKTTSDAASIPKSEFPPDPNSSKSTINTVVREVEEAGGEAWALPIDVRDGEAVQRLVKDVLK